MLRKMYHSYIARCDKKSERMEILMTQVSERIAILRKRGLYKDVHWTQEQQRAFDDFWLKNYGKKISNRWHKLYQSMNGVFCVDYFPEMLYTTKLEHKLNAYHYSRIYGDKLMTEELYSGIIPGVRAPKTLLCRDCKNYYIFSGGGYGDWYRQSRRWKFFLASAMRRLSQPLAPARAKMFA